MRFIIKGITRFSPLVANHKVKLQTVNVIKSIHTDNHRHLCKAANAFMQRISNYTNKTEKLKKVEDRVLSACKAFEGLNTKEISFPTINLKRCFSHAAPNSLAIIEKRILLVLRLYDKINPDKVTIDSNFITDLGLDSLDLVEVVMAIEDEFEFEIPDVDAEKFQTPRDIIRYVGDKEDVYE